jgi:microsomal dipeptidase-like Zn-dependent dipeptidase
LSGIDHVALGLDYVFDNELLAYLRAHPQTFGDDATQPEIHFVAPEQIPEIVDCLVAMGYGQSDIARILGLNLLRIAKLWK